MDPWKRAAQQMARTGLAVTVSYRAPRGSAPFTGLRLILGHAETDGLTRGAGVRVRKIAGFLTGLDFRPERQGVLQSETDAWTIEAASEDLERSGYTLDLAPTTRREEI